MTTTKRLTAVWLILCAITFWFAFLAPTYHKGVPTPSTSITIVVFAL